MKSIRNLALLTGLVAMALGLAVFGSPSRMAEADTPAPGGSELIVHKHCVPIGTVATFSVLLDFSFSGDNIVDTSGPGGTDVDEDTFFDVPFEISCGDESTTTAPNDGDTVTFFDGTGTEFDISGVIDWMEQFGTQTDATAVITETAVPGVDVIYAASGIGETSCDYAEDDIADFFEVGAWCLITNDFNAFAPNITVTKVFTGEPADQPFVFTLTTDAVDGCAISIDGGALAPILTGETFSLSNGQVATLACPPGVHTVTETPATDIPLTALDCTFVPAEAGTSDLAAGSFTFTPAVGTAISTADCTFTNGEDDGLDIVVKKECVGIDGTFTIDVGGAATELSQDVACGDFVTFEDLEPGTYTIEELLPEAGDGDDGDDPCDTCDACDDPCEDEEGAIATLIACSDLQQVDGTSVTVELVDVDIFCVFINSDEDLGDVVCGCGCGSLCLDLEIDNNNTNTIGIDNSNENNNANNNANDNDNENKNDNENNNENTNTQDQTNDQNQTNDNSQTNNIDSSPEVNIDFDDSH